MAKKQDSKAADAGNGDSIPAQHAQGNEFWWHTKERERLHVKLVPFAKRLEDLYKPAHQQDRAFERVYEARRLRGYQLAIRALQKHHGISAARLNVVKSVIDTVVSRLSKDRPMPAFDVDDSNWDLKRKAKDYRKFIVGKMTETEFDDLSRDALRDGGIIGTGITRIDSRTSNVETDDVFAERVLREELLFDPREAKYGKPRQAVFVHRIAKAYLAELYPAFKGQIWAAPPSVARPYEDRDEDETNQTADLADYADVYEGFHLRSTRDDTDGIRGLVIDGATLDQEDWESPRFPFGLFRYAKPLRGIWGKGLVAELADLQDRINCIVRDMQMNLAATGRGYYAVSEAADMPVEMMSGFAPFKMKFKGSVAPTFTVPNPINPAQLEMLQFFIQQAFELTGVSQAAAQSRSSLGPGASGVALDTQYDIDSERFAMVQAQYARYRLDCARLYLDAAKRVAKRRAEGKDKKKSVYVSMWRDRDAIEKLEYDKVELQDEEYNLRLEAVNYIPDTRAGKLSVVTQLAQAGVIPQWQVAMLFDEPDIMAANNLALAPLRNCLRKLDECLKTNMPVPVPEPYNDLELEKTISVAFYNLVQNDKAPDEIQERVRSYCDLVENAIGKKKQGDAALAAASAPPMGAAPPGAAPGMPGITPGAPTGAAPPTMGGAPGLVALQGGIS